MSKTDSKDLIVKTVTREDVDRVRGMLKGKGLLKALIADRKAEREASVRTSRKRNRSS